MFVDTTKIKYDFPHYTQYDKALLCYFEFKYFILKIKCSIYFAYKYLDSLEGYIKIWRKLLIYLYLLKYYIYIYGFCLHICCLMFLVISLLQFLLFLINQEMIHQKNYSSRIFLKRDTLQV